MLYKYYTIFCIICQYLFDKTHINIYLIFSAVADDTDKSIIRFRFLRTELNGVKKDLSDVNTNLQADKSDGIEKATKAVGGLNLKLVSAKLAAAALNATLTLGASLLIQKGVEWFDKWINKEKYAEQEAEKLQKKREELNQQSVESIKTYNSESKELNSLVEQYSKLIASTDDMASIKGELSKLQNQIINKYGQEADGIDLVNHSLEENIRLLTEKQKQEDIQWLRDNRENINNAQDFFGNDIKLGTYFSPEMGDMDEVQKEIQTYQNLVNTYLKTKYKDIYKNISFDNTSGMFTVSKDIGFEEQIKAIDAIVDAYEHIANAKENAFDYIKAEETLQVLYKLQKQAKNYGTTLRQNNDITLKVDARTALEEDAETYEKYQNLLADVTKLSATLNDSTANVAERISAGQQLQDDIISLQEIANQYPAVANIIESNLSGIGLSYESVTNTIDNAKETWLKSLDETQKGTIANVDKITSAMKKLVSGEAIDSKSAWEIINLDDNKLLSNISIDANGDYIFDLEQIIKLKDEIIQKEIETRQESIKTAKENAKSAEKDIKSFEQAIYNLRPKLAAAYDSGDKKLIAQLEKEYNRLKNRVEDSRTSLEAFNYTIRNESLYVAELKKRLGGLTDTTEILKAKIEQLKDKVESLEKEAEARLKAQEYVIDGIIDKYQKEADELEKQKEALNEQLETLEKQKDELDEIIGNYKTVSDFVSNTIEKQIDEIEGSKSKIEEYYDSLIEKLKEENEERQDAIDKEEKLAALANAQNNKVRYYDAERGWTYGVDQDALKKAQNDLDKTLNDEQIKDLEKQKKEEIAPLEEQIKALKEWSKEWGDATNFVAEAENELLAEEILGSDWREEIKSKDIATLDAFKTRYKNYNESLKNIVNTEMKSLKDSIKAKEDEIAAKKKQIQAWQEYKSEVQSAANDIKNGLEGYVSYLDTVKLSESSTNEERLRNLEIFKTEYGKIINQIASYNNTIDESEKKADKLSESFAKVAGAAQSVSAVGDYAGDMMDSIFSKFNTSGSSLGSSLGNSIGNSLGGLLGGSTSILDLNKPIEDLVMAIIKIFQNSIFNKIPHYAEGGVNTTTGFAWMDGTKANPELILNSADISRLYNWIHNMPNSVKSINNNSSTGGVMFSIGHMDINGVQNPTEFAREFERQINRYWSTKLTESKVY